MTRSRSVPILLAAVFALGCATSPQEPPDRPGIRILVENQHWFDVAVFLERNGVPHRLGTVRSQQRAAFEVRPRRLGITTHYHLLAEAIGGPGAIRSEPIPVAPGATTRWTLENRLEVSNLMIR